MGRIGESSRPLGVGKLRWWKGWVSSTSGGGRRGRYSKSILQVAYLPTERNRLIKTIEM